MHGGKIDEWGWGWGWEVKLQRDREFSHFTEIYITSRFFERRGTLAPATHCITSPRLPLSAVHMYYTEMPRDASDSETFTNICVCVCVCVCVRNSE
jgi:hypothetical protein